MDFHYEINGKSYSFSIPGGGFISLEHLVQVLGIAGTEELVQESRDALKAEEAVYASASDIPLTALDVNDVSVSDAARAFVADIAQVEFSRPDLVWTGRMETTAPLALSKKKMPW